MAGQPAQLSKITRVPYDPNLFIPENTAIKCSLDRRFISIWLASWSVRLMRTYTVQTGM